MRADTRQMHPGLGGLMNMQWRTTMPESIGVQLCRRISGLLLEDITMASYLLIEAANPSDRAGMFVCIIRSPRAKSRGHGPTHPVETLNSPTYQGSQRWDLTLVTETNIFQPYSLCIVSWLPGTKSQWIYLQR